MVTKILDYCFGTQPIVTGFNNNLNTSEETVSDVSALLASPILGSGAQLKIASASANDAVAGTGAKSIIIAGLNDGYIPIFETVSMNGQTVVTTTNYFLFVYGAEVNSAGSGGVNAGQIYVADPSVTFTSGVPGDLTKVYASILAGKNISSNGFWCAPAGMNYELHKIIVAARTQISHLLLRQKLTMQDNLWKVINEFPIGNMGIWEINMPRPIDVPAKSVIEFRAYSTTAGGVISVEAYLKLKI